MNPAVLLEYQAGKRGGQAALVQRVKGRDRVLTYEELHRAASSIAAQLRQSGLRAGEHVLIFHPVSIELYAVLLGLFRLGLTAVFVDPGQTREFMASCCRLVKPGAFIGSPRAHLLRLLCGEIRRIARRFHTAGLAPGSRRLVLESVAGEVPPVVVQDEAPALVTFTSGSTGAPKGIARSHAFLMAQHAALEHSLALTPGEVDLATLPVFVLANLASGLTTVLADYPPGKPGAADGRRIVAQIRDWQVTRLAASPAFCARLVEARVSLPGMRKIYTGGAPVFPSLMEQLAALCPASAVAAVYGSSEAEPMAHLEWSEVSAPDLAAMRDGAGLLAGHCVPEVCVAVIAVEWGAPLEVISAEEFESRRLPPGEPGEIVVTGPHVVAGYLHGAGDRETKFSVAGTVWHRTGDSGYIDSTGRLWLMGRCAAVIHLAGGRKVWPFCIETALSFLPEVNGVAVLPWEDVVLAVMEAPESVLNETLVSFLSVNGVASVLFTSIPRDRRHNAKTDYPALRQKLRSLAGRVLPLPMPEAGPVS